MQYFDIPPDAPLDADTLVHEALTKILPPRVPFGPRAPIGEYTFQVREHVGEEVIREFVRMNFPDYVERAKSILKRYKLDNESTLSDMAILEMRKAYDPHFDPLTSSPKLRVIYQLLVKPSWWL